jgi:hypothetical protein
MDHKQKIGKRQEANRQILKKISEMVEKHPDLRFHQILQSMKIQETETIEMSEVVAGDPFVLVCKDHFNEESIDTLNRIEMPS